MAYLSYGQDITVNSFSFYAWYFFRRIGIKLFLLSLTKKLLFWPRESNIQLPTPCWLLLLTVSLGDSVLLVIFHRPSFGNYYAQAAFALFLFTLPIFLLLIMKYLSLAAEEKRIVSTQISQSKIQNQYLLQQLEMTESLRKFRHDYKAHLFCIDTLLSAGEYDKLHEYLMSLHQYQYDGVHLRRFVDNESLNIILNQKITIAEKCGIDFRTNIVLPDNGKIAINDLNSLIVNLCDNAIEACAALPDARISLNIHKVKAYLILEVTNTCKSDIRKTNPEFLTQKSNPEFHGLGIKIIKNITQKYNGQYQISSTDHTFTTTLLLPDD